MNRASNVSPKAHLRVNEDLCYIEGHLRRHKACRLALTSLGMIIYIPLQQRVYFFDGKKGTCGRRDSWVRIFTAATREACSIVRSPGLS